MFFYRSYLKLSKSLKKLIKVFFFYMIYQKWVKTIHCDFSKRDPKNKARFKIKKNSKKISLKNWKKAPNLFILQQIKSRDKPGHGKQRVQRHLNRQVQTISS